jgi:hypothetical protein
MARKLLILAIAVFFITPSWANLIDPVVQDNQISGKIELPGNIEAELTIRFESVVGLSLENLGLSIHLVNPLDTALLSRLPSLNLSNSLTSGSLLAVPAAFPVLIRVEPPASGGLAFEGVVEVEIYTQNLQYTPGSPLRLFTAPDASSPFHDITDMISGGSVRTRSGGAHFSDFMIVLDTRPLSAVIGDKFDRLDALLVEHAMEINSVLLDELTDLVDQAYLAWNQGQPGQAMQLLNTLQSISSQAASLGQLANVWRSARDIRNIDGELRAAARTLRFSLSLESNLL